MTHNVLRSKAAALRMIADDLDVQANLLDLAHQDQELVEVKIITESGALTKGTYTYRHTSQLPVGTVVQVPGQRWSHQPTYAVVQGKGFDCLPGAGIGRYIRIERVIDA